MEKLEISSISSRGQVVIPQALRERLDIHGGEKFVVIGEEDTIVLKKLEFPSFQGFDKLIKKTRKFVKDEGLKRVDVEEVIRKIRKK